jgi:hypothetical protein
MNPPWGTPVSVWVWNGTYPSVVPTQSHDTDLATNPLFVQIASLNMTVPTWLPYYFTVNSTIATELGSRNQYYIGVRLDDGTNYRPLLPYDRNVEIGWIKLY